MATDPKNAMPGDANAMWGGRFTMSPSELMTEINASIGYDKQMWRQDIRGSKAHAAMLAEQGIIDKADEAAIQKGLDQVAQRNRKRQFPRSRPRSRTST